MNCDGSFVINNYDNMILFTWFSIVIIVAIATILIISG